MLHFDSDYMEGAHPELMRRLMETNLEQTVGYGGDDYCRQAKKLICEACGNENLDVYFLVGGTQTNATVIDALLYRHEGVLAAETAHINVHESGAIEASGHKVLALPSIDGKVEATEVETYIERFYDDETFEHMVAPGMLYITYPTEFGTIYTYQQLQELYDVCRKKQIPLYIDGARLGYGLMCDEADLTLQDIANMCDVFYIGGTKVGALFGEAVVARKGLLPHFFSLIKQHGALMAKGRLLGVQFQMLFTDNLYFKIARHAIDMAMMLKNGFINKGYQPYINSPTNQQFFLLPNTLIDSLSKNAGFEIWGTRGDTQSVVRFVTSWATQQESVEDLLHYIEPVQ